MGGLTTLLIPTAGVIWPLLCWWLFPSFLHREWEGGGQIAHSGSICLSVHSDPPHFSCLPVQLQSSVMAPLLPSDFLSFWKIIFIVIIRIYSDRSEHFTCFFSVSVIHFIWPYLVLVYLTPLFVIGRHVTQIICLSVWRI